MNANVLDSILIQPHEYIPLFLLPNRRPSRCAPIALHQLRQLPSNSLIVRLHRLGEREVAFGVFVPVEDDCFRGKRGEIVERFDHFVRCPFEETAASSNEECIACEHASGLARVGFVSYLYQNRMR